MNSARLHSARLADLLSRERVAMAAFLLALADFDRHRFWEALGYASLFNYLHRELGLSNGAAAQRKAAAELLQRLPQAIEPLRDGRLCLSSVFEVARVVTPENCAAVLPRFFHLSAREAREVSAELSPRVDPPRRDVVTTAGGAARDLTQRRCLTSDQPGAVAQTVLLVAPSATAMASATPAATLNPTAATNPTPSPASKPAATSTPTSTSTPAAPWPRTGTPTQALRDDIEPLTADDHRLHFNVSRRFLDKLKAARAGLAHSCPSASTEQVLEAALDLLLAQQAKRKGLVERPRKLPPPSKTDQIPANVRRAVWLRDQGRCTWPLDSGGCCGSTHCLQFDHIVPKARGGKPTIENVRLLCAHHNRLAARLAFGDRWMDRFTRGLAHEAPHGASQDATHQEHTHQEHTH
jgi:5-methylcytosine-specific restriction endonuclease McrA